MMHTEPWGAGLIRASVLGIIWRRWIAVDMHGTIVAGSEDPTSPLGQQLAEAARHHLTSRHKASINSHTRPAQDTRPCSVT